MAQLRARESQGRGEPGVQPDGQTDAAAGLQVLPLRVRVGGPQTLLMCPTRSQGMLLWVYPSCTLGRGGRCPGDSAEELGIAFHFTARSRSSAVTSKPSVPWRTLRT